MPTASTTAGATAMSTADVAKFRLFQLISPTLPTGSFSYSQGLEWAAWAGWVRDRDSLGEWLAEILEKTLRAVDLPLLARMYEACRKNDIEALDRWIDLLFACRENFELQEEERQRGRAMTALLDGLGMLDGGWRAAVGRSQLAGFAFAAGNWRIALPDAAMGYLWAWLENQVLAGVKIIPLGQTAGQQLLLSLGEKLPAIAEAGLAATDEEIGGSSPALALACCLHESQYTRLYRS